MSLTRIVVFIIGLVLAIVGLFMVVQSPHDLWNLVIGLILVIVGVIVMSGKVLTL